MKFSVEGVTVSQLHGPTISPRMREVISRMTDRQMLTVDINSVMSVIYLQHNDTPIASIPEDWWQEVMRGAKIR